MRKYCESIKSLYRIWYEQWNIYPWGVLANIFESVLYSSIMGMSILFPRMIVEEISDVIDIESILLMVSTYALLSVLFHYLIRRLEDIRYRSSNFYPNSWLKKMAEKMMHMDYADVDNPDFVQAYQSAQSAVYTFSENAIDIIRVIIMNMIELVMLFIIIGNLDFLAVVLLLFTSSTSIYIDSKINQSEYDYRGTRSAEMIGRNYATCLLHGVFPGIKDIMAFDGQEMLVEKIRTSYQNVIDLFSKKQQKQFWLMSVQYMIKGVELFALYLLIARKYTDGLLTAGTLLMYVTAANEFKSVLNNSLAVALNIGEVSNYRDLYQNIVDREEKIRNTGRVIPQDQIDTSKIKIEFRNVSFRYAEGLPYALKDLSFTVMPGEKCLLVGENGAGKSTIVKLLTRLYEPTKGTILINDIDIRDFDYDEYQRLFGVVFQEIQMFGASTKENILFGKEELDVYSELVNKLGIEALSERDNAEELSGGQQQLVALARALCRKSPVDILDEVTSAIDPLKEGEIYSFIKDFDNEKTAIYISHRLSLGSYCEKIICMENGRIKEMGSHAELLARQGLYYSLFETQAKGYR